VNIGIEHFNVYDVNMEAEKPLVKVGYHHGQLKEALLDAGLQMLVAQGAAELSLRAVAKTLGVSANAAYRHFASKEDWLNAMAADGFRRFAQAQRNAISAFDEPLPRLLAAGRAYMAFATQEHALYRLMFDQITQPHGDQALLEASMDAMSVLLDCASALTQQPATHESTRVLAAAAWGFVHGLSDLTTAQQLTIFDIPPHDLLDKIMQQPMAWSPPAEKG
jgi:AcrR family transcriptional regulator